MSWRGRVRGRTGVRVLVVVPLVATVLLVGVGTASAHESPGSHHPPHHHQGHHGCVDGRDPGNLVATLSPDGSTVTVHGRQRLCRPMLLLFGAYAVPATWDRVRFDTTAVPQYLVDDDRGWLVGSHTLRLHVRLPCGNVQVDLYYPPRIVTVGPHGHHGQLVKARLWHRSDCHHHQHVDRQTVAATIPCGVLVLSTPFSSDALVDLLASTPQDQLAVTDVRSGDIGWTLTIGTTQARRMVGTRSPGHQLVGTPARMVADADGPTVTITVY